MDMGSMLIILIFGFSLVMLFQKNDNKTSNVNIVEVELNKCANFGTEINKSEEVNLEKTNLENINLDKKDLQESNTRIDSTFERIGFEVFDEDIEISKFPYNGNLKVVIEDISLRNSKPYFDSGVFLISELPKLRPYFDYGYYFELTVKPFEIETNFRIRQNIFLNVKPDFLVQVIPYFKPFIDLFEYREIDPFVQLFYSIVTEQNKNDLKQALSMIEKDIIAEKVEPLIKDYFIGQEVMMWYYKNRVSNLIGNMEIIPRFEMRITGFNCSEYGYKILRSDDKIHSDTLFVL